MKRFTVTKRWQSKAHRAWFQLCSVCLALYIAYAAYLSCSGFLRSGAETAAALFWFALIACGLYRLLTRGCCGLESSAPKAKSPKAGDGQAAFWWTAGLCLLVLGVSLAACYPGGVSYDAANQWIQAQTGEFNNWHPVFHTLLLWLVTRVYNSYAFAVLVQITAFSLAMGYGAATLVRYGAPKALAVGVCVLSAASEPVKNCLMYLWKDNAMTIGCLMLCSQSVHLLYTRGQWLKKPGNAVAFGMVLAFTTLVRHNAVLFTLPLLLLTLCLNGFPKRRALAAAGVFALCLVLVRGPLYGTLNIVYPNNTTEEAVGLPMTILANARQCAPEALDDESRAFLDSLATDEKWQTVYRRSSYNSIKFTYPRESIKNRPLGEILTMALATAGRAPRLTFETVNEVTGLVWSLAGENNGYETVSNSGDLSVAHAGNAALRAVGGAVNAVLQAPFAFLPLSYLTRNIGVMFLCLLLVALWALRRCGVRALLLALPTLCYNLATMLVLCGQDARFFQFSMAVSLPSMLALLYAPVDLDAKKVAENGKE